jgi:hypothetical protein
MNVEEASGLCRNVYKALGLFLGCIIPGISRSLKKSIGVEVARRQWEC